LGQREAAQSSLQRCLQLDPQFQPAKAGLQELAHQRSLEQTPLPKLEQLTPQPEPQPVDGGS
ncbi:MAG: hypothetical protein Q6K80_10190, partial [Thermostichus sp. DG_1_6_bins_120]